MDNRFKTRAWLINEKRMVEVNALKADGTIIFELNEIIYASHESFHIKLQCTGLLATSSYRGESEEDRLIFEGDVLYNFWDCDETSSSVTWGGDGFLVNLSGETLTLSEVVDGADDAIRIIGNIHEHPWLLDEVSGN